MKYFLERYAQITKDSIEEIKECTVPKVLRVNTLKTNKKELCERLLKKKVKLTKVPFLENAYYYTAPFSLGATPEYLLGYYYLQEAASQLPVTALMKKIKKQATVLDMAAAPGSKTTQLAAAMQNKGRIVALDSSEKRCQALANNLERCGVTNTVVYHKDANFVRDLDMQFDAILLDAPCSGNFAIDKKWFKKRKPEDAKLQAKTQIKLLKAALAVLKPKGFLLYSTCSLEPEENEAVVNQVLSDNISLVDLELEVGDKGLTAFRRKKFSSQLIKARRLWPHKHNTQGFFIAMLKKE